MQRTDLGPLGKVSRLTLGGGGIGQAWGPTTREEAHATLKLAFDSGIDLLDTAPMYLNCEEFVGEYFNGKLPPGVRITSKVRLGSPPPEEVEKQIVASLDKSLATMRVGHIDLFFLHTNICDDGYVYAIRPDRQNVYATTWTIYTQHFVPAMEKLKSAGKIRAWGITGSGVPGAVMRALRHVPHPAAVQAVTNLLDSAGGLRNYAEPAEPRAIIKTAKDNGVGVLGIRAVQAGALTAAIDRTLKDGHPEIRDYEIAAPYRALCKEIGQDPAFVAHRYALGMDGVDTVILGVKNRAELQQCLDAEKQGPLDPALVKRIDALGVRERVLANAPASGRG